MARLYFAGLQLEGSKGLSSDDVIFYRLLGLLPSFLEGVGVFFLPTVSDQIVEDRGKTRIWVHHFVSWSDYVIMTRPLSFSVDEVEEIALKLKQKGNYKLIASIASHRLSSLKMLAERLADKVDGFEVDLGLLYLLAGGRRGFEAYAIDILEEFISSSSKPVMVKLNPVAPLTQEFIRQLKSIGITALVFSPHVIYSVGNEFFRVHSTYLSKIYALIWAKLIAASDVPSAYISDVPEDALSEFAVEKSFDIILYDTALLKYVVDLPQVNRFDDEFLVKWVKIPERLRPAVNAREEPNCTRVCPFRAFNPSEPAPEASSEILVASENCDKCGLCLSCCRSARFVAVISPE